MVCGANAFVGTRESDKKWTNWNGDVTFKASEYFEPAHSSAGAPDGLLQLVHVVARATKEKRRLHAIGSGWAFETIAASDAWVVSLAKLNRRLHNVVSPTSVALTDQWRAKQRDARAARKLVHVEAGIELGGLIKMLDSDGLAMPTLGGHHGQSLAGAISTSTHGGDWEQPPLPDLVRAIHLVTESGRELWIERASEPITNDRLTSVLTCPETEIIRDDDVFESAVVSFGRFGVIYAFVLEVRKVFRVVEVVTKPARVRTLQALRDGTVAGPLFAPLLSLLRETLPPATLAERDGVIANQDPYFFQIVFNSQDPDDCWAHRRWVTNELADLPKVDPLLVRGTFDPDGPAVFLIAEAVLTAAAGVAAAVPVVGPAYSIAMLALAADMAFRAKSGPPLTFGTAAALALSAVWKLPFVGDAIPSIAHQIIGGEFKDAMTDGRRGPHHLLTSKSDAEQDIKFRTESIEVIFDATRADYLNFLDVLLPSAPSFRQFVAISIRPSRMSYAAPSMHSVSGSHAISIEVSTLKHLDGNSDWMKFVERLAISFGGRPHWGQINNLTEDQVLTLYGENFTKWRAALARVSGNSRLFSNRFTRRRGLEPKGMMREVTGIVRQQRLHLPPGRVTHLLGEGATWSPVTVEQAAREISGGTVVYYKGGGGRESIVHVATRNGRTYLRTGPDGVGGNNLGS